MPADAASWRLQAAAMHNTSSFVESLSSYDDVLSSCDTPPRAPALLSAPACALHPISAVCAHKALQRFPSEHLGLVVRLGTVLLPSTAHARIAQVELHVTVLKRRPRLLPRRRHLGYA